MSKKGMVKVKKDKLSDLAEAFNELSSELVEVDETKKAKKKKKEVVVEDKIKTIDKYNGFEKDNIIEIPRVGDVDRLADSYQIESICVDNENRIFANLNRITVTGKVDKRYKLVKKYFDENTLIKVNALNKGDKVFLDKRGTILWENNDYTRQIKKNFFYTVRSNRYESGYIYTELEESGVLLHPNHFVKKED